MRHANNLQRELQRAVSDLRSTRGKVIELTDENNRLGEETKQVCIHPCTSAFIVFFHVLVLSVWYVKITCLNDLSTEGGGVVLPRSLFAGFQTLPAPRV